MIVNIANKSTDNDISFKSRESSDNGDCIIYGAACLWLLTVDECGGDVIVRNEAANSTPIPIMDSILIVFLNFAYISSEILLLLTELSKGDLLFPLSAFILILATSTRLRCSFS